MLSKKFFAVCAAGLSLCASNAIAADWNKNQGGNNANAAVVASHLEQGGSYYLVTDAKAAKPQIQFLLKNIIARFPAATSQKMNKVMNLVDIGLALSGINDINGIGQSSKIMIPAQGNQPAVYHNRLVITTDPAKKFPLLLQLCNGNAMKLNDVADMVPDNAKLAFFGSINPKPIYVAADAMGFIKNDIKAGFAQNVGVSFDTLIDTITGDFGVILFGATVQNGPEGLVRITDKNNVIFKLICKVENKNPETEKFIVFQEVDSYVKIVKAKDSLRIYLGKNTEAMIQQKLQARQTLKNTAAFKKMSAKIPPAAQAYDFDCLNFGKTELVGISATVYNQNNICAYNNSFYDWDVLPLAVCIKIADEVMAITGAYAQELPIPEF